MLSNIPKSWDDVYLDQFIELKKIDSTESFYERQTQILSILTDMLPDDEYWDDIDVNDLSDAIQSINWIKNEPSTAPLLKFDQYTSIDINKLLFEEWIDLEHYFQDYFNNLHIIASIMYRRTMKDKWDHVIYEELGSYNIEERASIFLEMPITNFFWLTKYYLSFKESILTEYSNLFEPLIEDDEELEEVTEEYEADEKEQIEYEKIAKKWSWENVLYRLADGDITKYEQILKMPFIFIMNQLSFQKEMKL